MSELHFLPAPPSHAGTGSATHKPENIGFGMSYDRVLNNLGRSMPEKAYVGSKSDRTQKPGFKISFLPPAQKKVECYCSDKEIKESGASLPAPIIGRLNVPGDQDWGTEFRNWYNKMARMQGFNEGEYMPFENYLTLCHVWKTTAGEAYDNYGIFLVPQEKIYGSYKNWLKHVDYKLGLERNAYNAKRELWRQEFLGKVNYFGILLSSYEELSEKIQGIVKLLGKFGPDVFEQFSDSLKEVISLLKNQDAQESSSNEISTNRPVRNFLDWLTGSVESAEFQQALTIYQPSNGYKEKWRNYPVTIIFPPGAKIPETKQECA